MGDNGEGIVSTFVSWKTYVLHGSGSITVTLSLSPISKRTPTGSPNTVYWQGRDRTKWLDFVDNGVDSAILYEKGFENRVYKINITTREHYYQEKPQHKG